MPQTDPRSLNRSGRRTVEGADEGHPRWRPTHQIPVGCGGVYLLSLANMSSAICGVVASRRKNKGEATRRDPKGPQNAAIGNRVHPNRVHPTLPSATQPPQRHDTLGPTSQSRRSSSTFSVMSLRLARMRVLACWANTRARRSSCHPWVSKATAMGGG